MTGALILRELPGAAPTGVAGRITGEHYDSDQDEEEENFLDDEEDPINDSRQKQNYLNQ